MITTTLKRIRARRPCGSSWHKLLSALGKTKADDEPLAYADILRHLNLDDALWCLRCEPQHALLWRHMACDFADTVRHLLTDPRSHEVIRIARLYADGRSTDKELAAAWDAAWDAARAAAKVAAVWDAAKVTAAWAAAKVAAKVAAAWAAAEDAARDAAWAAAWDAARAAAKVAAAGDAAGDAYKAIFLHRVNGDTPIYAWGSGVRIDWRVAA